LRIDPLLELVRDGRLYPGVILHGGSHSDRIESAVVLAQALLCGSEAPFRPCGECRHCQRIVGPSENNQARAFHPDFMLLEQDLRTSTSADAMRAMLRNIQVSPFEARGQVFVVVNAETLSDSAANALLKNLEEPPTSAPRHFILLCPSAVDLLPTLRSRCLSFFLGGEAETGAAEKIGELAREIAPLLDGYRATASAAYLQNVAAALLSAGGFDEIRSTVGWDRASRSLLEICRNPEILYEGPHGPVLELAEELLMAVDMRMRSIPAPRVMEGLVAKHLVALRRA
jgi:hypothetical protein